MRNQFIGDINDYRKYGLFRLLDTGPGMQADGGQREAVGSCHQL
jgi:hypothetical protein